MVLLPSSRHRYVSASNCAIYALRVKSRHSFALAVTEDQVISTATSAASPTACCVPHCLSSGHDHTHHQIADAIAQSFSMSIHRIQWQVLGISFAIVAYQREYDEGNDAVEGSSDEGGHKQDLVMRSVAGELHSDDTRWRTLTTSIKPIAAVVRVNSKLCSWFNTSCSSLRSEYAAELVLVPPKLTQKVLLT